MNEKNLTIVDCLKNAIQEKDASINTDNLETIVECLEVYLPLVKSSGGTGGDSSCVEGIKDYNPNSTPNGLSELDSGFYRIMSSSAIMGSEVRLGMLVSGNTRISAVYGDYLIAIKNDVENIVNYLLLGTQNITKGKAYLDGTNGTSEKYVTEKYVNTEIAKLTTRIEALENK